MQRVVGGVQVQHEALRRHQVLLEEGLDEKGLQGIEMGDDLLVAAAGVGPHRSEFEAVERALAGQGPAAVAAPQTLVALGIFLADQDGQEGIVAQGVVVVEVFVAQAQAEDTLPQEFRERVFDPLGVAVIAEAARELLDEAELVLDFAQQQAARIGRDQSAVETRDDGAGAQVLEMQFGWITLCHSKTAPTWERKWLLLSSLTSRGAVL